MRTDDLDGHVRSLHVSSGWQRMRSDLPGTSDAPEISDEVRRFIDRYIDSIERLEVLLLLQKNPERQWTAGSVASELRISVGSADKQLAKLCSYNLLNVRIEKDLFYRFDPRPAHLEHGARALAAAYAEQRLVVIKLILDRLAEPMRDFAEAFRVTKKDGSDG